jgi:hypothetical protein
MIIRRSYAIYGIVAIGIGIVDFVLSTRPGGFSLVVITECVIKDGVISRTFGLIVGHINNSCVNEVLNRMFQSVTVGCLMPLGPMKLTEVCVFVPPWFNFILFETSDWWESNGV